MFKSSYKSSACTALVFSSALFASGYIFARGIDPLAGMGMFVTQAMLSCALTLSLFGGKWTAPSVRVSRVAVASVIFNGVGSPAVVWLVMEGSRIVTPSLASVIVISNVLMIAVMAWALGRKRFRRAQLIALMSGFAGVAWLSLQKGAMGGEGLGVVYLMSAAVLIASITIAIEKPVKQIGWRPVTLWSFWIGFATSITMVTAGGLLKFYSVEQTILAALCGAVGLAAPVLMFNMGMSRLGSADAAAFKLLIPFFAFVYGIIILGETPDLTAGMAGALVVASVAGYQLFNGKTIGAGVCDTVPIQPDE